MTTRAKKSLALKDSSRNSSSLKAAVRLVRGARRILVATHRNPDGDALGSALALARGLRQIGKIVSVYNADAVPEFLRFLPGSSTVTSRLSPKEAFDLSMIVDCSDMARVGKAFCDHSKKGPVVVLDHHPRGRHGGDVAVIDPSAASSGVIVYRFLARLGVSIDRSLATALYVTLVTDTGNFRYSNTSSEVLELASLWVRAGASPDAISRSLHDHAPLERLKLLGAALETLELSEAGRVASLTVNRNLLKSTGATLEMADDFVDFPRSLKSVEIAVLFRESGEGWRVSLRSKTKADVGACAVRMGGGGHRRAAGFTVLGPFEDVRRRTMAVLREELSKYPIYKRKGAC